MSGSRKRLALGALAAVVLALAILLLVAVRPGGGTATAGPADDAPAASPGLVAGEPVAAPALEAEPAPAAADPEALVMASGRPFWRPGQPHWYGPREDPFVRQPHDYPPGTPDRLGNRISQHLFDLERVGDMVRRGQEGDSEIALLRGRPLDDDEYAQARAVLQQFFDETVPVVDAVLADELSRDQAYDRIGPRRWQMNADLRQALGLSEEELARLWPHIAELAGSVDQLRD